MQVLTSLEHANVNPQGCAAAIGNFDGVHLGHQAIIKQLQSFAELISTVIIFEPQPLEFFQGNAA
ncbi:MAG: adenylyltransferase/cytidyltransferase family protein, partial [Gammaproteobacteria bacterium]|nr:adenylyltransferase/cytidyltransferase family protein [Gammaproteobacteria bacterium]